MDRAQIPEAAPLPCPEAGCGGWMILQPSRFGLFYGCQKFPVCRATHGAHPDGKPLGVPADGPTKQARMSAHTAFDRLWSEIAPSYVIPKSLARSARKRNEYRIRKRGRTRAYRWLAEQLGIQFEECHIGAMDAAMCARVAELCRPMDAEKVRAWSKERGL